MELYFTKTIQFHIQKQKLEGNTLKCLWWFSLDDCFIVPYGFFPLILSPLYAMSQIAFITCFKTFMFLSHRGLFFSRHVPLGFSFPTQSLHPWSLLSCPQTRRSDTFSFSSPRLCGTTNKDRLWKSDRHRFTSVHMALQLSETCFHHL
jgi:hypothetical protein